MNLTEFKWLAPGHEAAVAERFTSDSTPKAPLSSDTRCFPTALPPYPENTSVDWRGWGGVDLAHPMYTFFLELGSSAIWTTSPRGQGWCDYFFFDSEKGPLLDKDRRAECCLPHWCSINGSPRACLSIEKREKCVMNRQVQAWMCTRIRDREDGPALTP